MAIKIKHTVGVYIVNRTDQLYKHYHQKKNLKKFLDSIKQTHSIKYISVPNMYRIGLRTLGTLTRDLNVVIIPSSTFFFDAFTCGDAIVMVVSLDAGNPKYSHGIYYQSLSLVRKFLGGEKVDVGMGSVFYRMKPEGRAIIVASMVDVADFKVFGKLYNKLTRISLDLKVKDAIIKILHIKRNKYNYTAAKETA
jgi:hypothetical protein